MEANDRAKEIADKMDVNHFNKRLQDNTHAFMQLIKQKKSDLTKGDLISLVTYLVKYPDIDGQLVNGNVVELARLGGENKDLVVALTVQVLMEEGQRKATPKFKPKGE